jgi:GMP synthase-like glutamine amidotransferase
MLSNDLCAKIAAAVVAAALIVRARRRRRPIVLAVLNHRLEGSAYNANVMPMLTELFAAVNANVALRELDVLRDDSFDGGGNVRDADSFDGFVLPGSLSSAYGNERWIERLSETVRSLHAQRRPVLGICFGHQIVAHALGGNVAPNRKAGLQSAGCTFELTPTGRSLFGGAREAARTLQYYHNDVVVELPPCATSLGTSAANSAHAAAVWPAARSGEAAGGAPTMITFQAHPEFSTPTGTKVLQRILRGEAGKRGEPWLRERLATTSDNATAATALQMTAAATALLWPKALNYM